MRVFIRVDESFDNAKITLRLRKVTHNITVKHVVKSLAMTICSSIGLNVYLLISNKMELDFCWYQLHIVNKINPIPSPPKKLNKASIAILESEMIRLYEPNISDGCNWLNLIVKRCHQSSLTENDMVWLKQKDNRLIHWLWILLTTYENLFKVLIPDTDITLTNSAKSSNSFFDKFLFNINAYSTTEKHEIILNYFVLTDIHKDKKRELINILITKWNSMKKEESFNWFYKEDEKLSPWALNYLHEYSYSKENHMLLKDLEHIHFENDSDKFVALLDTSNALPEQKKTFLKSIKKALAQKKYRDKQTRKKQCTFKLSEDSIEQLSKISKWKKTSKDKIINEIIKKEYLKSLSNI
ncbi:hypothetical protein VT25_09260 [Photobacterium leiognathi subsp. mandapamensis]|nr:hypothetical protein VT25_09260 [Photobacterium leiognathi subsp. mandapamensis]